MSDLSTKFNGKSEAEKNQRRVRCAAAEGLLFTFFSPTHSLAAVRCCFWAGNNMTETGGKQRDATNARQRNKGEREGWRERETAGRKRQLGRGGTEHTHERQRRGNRSEKGTRDSLSARGFRMGWLMRGEETAVHRRGDHGMTGRGGARDRMPGRRRRRRRRRRPRGFAI